MGLCLSHTDALSNCVRQQRQVTTSLLLVRFAAAAATAAQAIGAAVTIKATKGCTSGDGASSTINSDVLSARRATATAALVPQRRRAAQTDTVLHGPRQGESAFRRRGFGLRHSLQRRYQRRALCARLDRKRAQFRPEQQVTGPGTFVEKAPCVFVAHKPRQRCSCGGRQGYWDASTARGWRPRRFGDTKRQLLRPCAFFILWPCGAGIRRGLGGLELRHGGILIGASAAGTVALRVRETP